MFTKFLPEYIRILSQEEELKKYEGIASKVKQKQALVAKIEDLENAKSQQEAQRNKCFRENATLILAAQIYADQVQNEDEQFTEYYISATVRDHLLHLMEQPKCVCGASMDTSRIREIKKYIDENFITDDALLAEKERKALFRVCDKYRDHGIKSRESYFAICEAIFNLDMEISTNKAELAKLKRDIGSFREEAGEKIQREIERAETKKADAITRKDKTEVRLELAQQRLSSLEAQLADYSQTDEQGALCQKKLEKTIQYLNLFVAYKERLLEKKRQAVEDCATEVFRKITNAPQKYRGIKIDTDYSLLLELTNGDTYRIEPGRTLNPSTGQSKVISLSYIAGLNRSSDFAAPIIIDNPLGLFSDEHRTAITEYLPHFGKQVIFMVSTGDLTDKYRDILAPYVKTEYYLENQSHDTWPKTTIVSQEVH